MRRFYALGLTLSIVLAVVVPLVMAFVPQADALTQSIMCPAGTTLERDESPASDGGTSISFYCVGKDGERTSADGPFAVIIIVLVMLPFLFTMLLVMASVGKFGTGGVVLPPGSVSVQTFTTPEFQAMTAELARLKQDFHAGRISASEFQAQATALAQRAGLNNADVSMDVQVRGAAGGTLADRLRQLQDAYDAGLLTRDEFDQRRQALLDQLSGG